MSAITVTTRWLLERNQRRMLRTVLTHGRWDHLITIERIYEFCANCDRYVVVISGGHPRGGESPYPALARNINRDSYARPRNLKCLCGPAGCDVIKDDDEPGSWSLYFNRSPWPAFPNHESDEIYDPYLF